MKVLLTGATGLLGRQILQELIQRKVGVRCLVRSVPKKGTELPQADYAVGDLTDLSSLKRALEGGATAVIHCAAIQTAREAEAYDRVNVEGTANLVRACEEAGVGRFLHVSSITVSLKLPDPYSRSKAEGERRVQASRLAWTVFRPGIIVGDSTSGRVAELSRWVRRLPIVPVPQGEVQIPLVRAQDAAKAIVESLFQERSIGQTYELVPDRTISLGDLVDRLAKEQGIRRAKLPLPIWLCRLGGRVLRMSGAAPDGSIDRLLEYRRKGFDLTTNEKARRDLGFSPNA